MKTQEELNALKLKYEELYNKLKELTDDEIKEVIGGNNANNMVEGIAGAYGGSDDFKKPITVTGEVVDDYSMGVAISMSWPNYRSYLGKMVLINYNGKNVLAKINDFGVLNDRNLDLQPGVFKSFGFKSCRDFGIRLINYCVL